MKHPLLSWSRQIWHDQFFTRLIPLIIISSIILICFSFLNLETITASDKTITPLHITVDTSAKQVVIGETIDITVIVENKGDTPLSHITLYTPQHDALATFQIQGEEKPMVIIDELSPQSKQKFVWQTKAQLLPYEQSLVLLIKSRALGVPLVSQELLLTVESKNGSDLNARLNKATRATFEDPEPWALTYTPPGASAFTGAAQYQTGIKVPPGVGGLAPTIALNYNSRGVDSYEEPVMARGFGLGWSMPQAEITNENANKMFDKDPINGDPNSACTDGFRNTRFTLHLNGSSYPLEPASGVIRHGRYYAMGDPSLLIEYKDDSSSNITGEYWLVRTSSGVSYTFGYSDNAEHVIAPLKEQCFGSGTAPNAGQPQNDNFATTSWKLDEITDVYNNKVNYVYNDICGKESTTPHDPREFSLDGGGETCTEADVAIDYIVYNYEDVNDDTTAHTAVEFSYETTNTGLIKREDFMTVGYYRPTTINVWYDQQRVRRYHFDYEEKQHHHAPNNYTTHYWWITDITEYGSDNVSTLPTQTFTYDHDTNGACENSTPSGPQHCVYLLTKVDNGYGAITEIIYASINNGAYGDWFHVSDIYTWDGVENQHSSNVSTATTHTHYDRTGATACFDDTSSVCNTPHSTPSHALVGFDKVKILSGKGTNYLSEQRQTFNMNNYWLKGQVDTAEQYDPNITNRLLSSQTNTWSLGTHRFVRLDNTEYRTYDPSGNGEYAGAKEIYSYTSTWGHRWRTTYQYRDENGVWQTDNKHQTFYLDDFTNWRVVPWANGVYSASDEVLALTLYYYDNNITEHPADTQPITDGELKLTRQLLVNEAFTFLGNTTYPTVDTLLDYDDYGNVKKVTTYEGYGEVGENGSSWVHMKAPGDGSATHVTETKYKDAGTLIDWVENTFNHRTTFAYTDASHPWVPTQVTDHNGLITSFGYDTFGRLEQTIRGGTDITTYDYNDSTATLGNGTPLKITVSYADNSWERGFYDGLGRHLQTQIPDEDGSHKLVTDFTYDALGRQTAVSLPYQVTSSSNYHIPNPNADQTLTAYDALSRVSTTTPPSGHTTQHFYGVDNGVSYHDMLDANYHWDQQWFNGKGQLIEVREVSGDCDNQYTNYRSCPTGGTPWVIDTKTFYTYDLLGNLTEVKRTDASTIPVTELVTTTMTYDAFGRKLTMTDPDMGEWHYKYDALDNLTSQTDNKGKLICFFYDDLNRLIGKMDPNGISCPTSLPSAPDSRVLTRYTYDSNTEYLTKVRWDGDQQYDAFTYDNLGRMTSHTRRLDDRPYVMTTQLFDARHRPLEVVYPDGEVVVMTYDFNGQNSLAIQGGNSLIDNITYNPRGQVTEVSYTSSAIPDVEYTYLGASGDFRLDTIQAGSMMHYQYQYDPVGNITQIDTVGTTEVEEFTYDELDRLISAGKVGGDFSIYDHDYEYDLLGNITEFDGRSYTYDQPHSNCNATSGLPSAPHAVKQIGSDYYCYDKNGNMILRYEDGTSYQQIFDLENRLESVTADNQTTLFQYDADGIRTTTIKPDGSIVYTPFPNYSNEYSELAYIWHMDEGTGTDLGDEGVSDHDGKFQTGSEPTWYTQGKFGSALDFNGVDQYVPFIRPTFTANAMTISAWVRPEQAPTGTGRIVASTYDYNSGGDTRRGWYLGDANGSADHFEFKVFDNNGQSAEIIYNDFFNTYEDEWVLVTGVFEPSQSLKLYINGGLVATDTSNIPSHISQTDLFKIGARADNTTQGFWDGQIDELSILNRALSAQEIRDLAPELVWENDFETASDWTEYAHPDFPATGLRHGIGYLGTGEDNSAAYHLNTLPWGYIRLQ